MTMTRLQKLNHCYEAVKARIGDFVPKVALVLGSGLGALADEIDVVATVDFHEIENFPRSTVQGHKGRFVFGYIAGEPAYEGDDVSEVAPVPVVIMQGRVHYYEGYTMADVVLPIRLMRKLGAEILFLTNASGGINYTAGTFMLITDHISTFVQSALVGPNMDEFGVRFPDMTTVYNQKLNSIIWNFAERSQIKIKEGIYVQTTGPNFETPAEVRMLKTLGADAVGMSTACEAMAANHAGMKVCGISCVANLAAGLSANPLTHDEVMEAANTSAPLFKKLIKGSISAMGEV